MTRLSLLRVFFALSLLLIFSPVTLAGDYENRIAAHLKGTWEGTFEHLYLPHNELRVVVTIKSMNLSSIYRDSFVDEQPEGEVKLILGGRVQLFSLTQVFIAHAFREVAGESNDDHDDIELKEPPEKARIVLAFENNQKVSELNFPIGLFQNPYTKVTLGEDLMTLGFLEKR